MPKRRSIKYLRNSTLLELGVDIDDSLKTSRMFLLERKYNKTIRDLLAPNGKTDIELAKELGEGVTVSNICRWRKRLGIKVVNSRQYKPVV